MDKIGKFVLKSYQLTFFLLNLTEKTMFARSYFLSPSMNVTQINMSKQRRKEVPWHQGKMLKMHPVSIFYDQNLLNFVSSNKRLFRQMFHFPTLCEQEATRKSLTFQFFTQQRGHFNRNSLGFTSQDQTIEKL